MERTHLNKAHEAGRRAVNCVQRGQLAEAVDSHLKAAKLLHQLEGRLGKDSWCKRSLEEQASFHERQAELARVLRELFDSSYKREKMGDKYLERKRVLRPLSENSRPPLPFILPSHPDEIFRQIDEADSLLQILSNRKSTTNTAGGVSGDGLVVGPHGQIHRSQSADTAADRAIEFTIRPKNDAEVIEELQIVNSNLRSLVDKLLTELNESKEENKELRRKLTEYEHDTSIIANNKRGRQNTVSVEENIESPSFNETPTVVESHSLYMDQDIPELDPLEDPDLNELEEFSSSYISVYRRNQ